MPINYELRDGIIFTIMTGDISPGEVYDHIDKLTNDHDISRTFIEVVDLTDVTHIEIDNNVAARIAAIAKDLAKNYISSYIITIAPSTVAFGIARMVEIYVEIESNNITWNTVKTMEEANRLLAELKTHE